ncbi:hypothetical protein GEMRC1_011101 [Eukaryota sp. GEM-RC1]
MSKNIVAIDFGTNSIKIYRGNDMRVDPVMNERGEAFSVNLLQRNGKKFLFGSRVLSKLRLRSHKSLLGPQVILSRSNVPLSQYLLSGHQKDSNTFTLDNTNFSLHDILVEIFKYLKSFIPNVHSSKVFFSYSPLFNDHHSVLINAASEAGLNVEGVFPSSKCIAASLLFKHPELNENIGVFDFGYSTTKFTAFSIKNGTISILFDQEMAMGARDFDEVLLNHCIAQKPLVDFTISDRIEILENIQNFRNYFGVEPLSFEISNGSVSGDTLHFEISVDNLMLIFANQLNFLRNFLSQFLEYHDSSFVVIGGFSNCPLIEQQISEILNKQVKRILNPFSDVSIGCCLLGNGFSLVNSTESFNENPHSSALRSRTSSFTDTNSPLHGEHLSLKSKYNKLDQDNQNCGNLQSCLEQLESPKSELLNTINNLSSENQQLKQELQEVKVKQNHLITDWKLEINRLKQSAKVLSGEKEELLLVIEKLNEEKSNLNHLHQSSQGNSIYQTKSQLEECHQLREDNRILEHDIHHLREEVARLQSKVNELNTKKCSSKNTSKEFENLQIEHNKLLEQYRDLQQENGVLIETVGRLRNMNSENLKTITDWSEENLSLREENSRLKAKVDQYEFKPQSLIDPPSTSQNADPHKEPETPTRPVPSPSLTNHRSSVDTLDLNSIIQSLKCSHYSDFLVLSDIIRGLGHNIRDDYLASAAIDAYAHLQSSHCPLIQALSDLRSNLVQSAASLLQQLLADNSDYVVAESTVLILKIRLDHPTFSFRDNSGLSFDHIYTNQQLKTIVNNYFEEFKQQSQSKEKLLKLERAITDWMNQQQLSNEQTNFLRTKLNHLRRQTHCSRTSVFELFGVNSDVPRDIMLATIDLQVRDNQGLHIDSRIAHGPTTVLEYPQCSPKNLSTVTVRFALNNKLKSCLVNSGHTMVFQLVRRTIKSVKTHDIGLQLDPHNSTYSNSTKYATITVSLHSPPLLPYELFDVIDRSLN